MNIEEIDILKELSEQTYFGDLLFSYYADLIGKLLTAYEKEKEENKKLEKMIKKDKDALQFKVGDIVRLKYKSSCTFAIEEGAVCKITNIERQARYPIEIENKFNGVKGYVAEDYIEKIEVEE